MLKKWDWGPDWQLCVPIGMPAIDSAACDWLDRCMGRNWIPQTSPMHRPRLNMRSPVQDGSVLSRIIWFHFCTSKVTDGMHAATSRALWRTTWRTTVHGQMPKETEINNYDLTVWLSGDWWKEFHFSCFCVGKPYQRHCYIYTDAYVVTPATQEDRMLMSGDTNLIWSLAYNTADSLSVCLIGLHSDCSLKILF